MVNKVARRLSDPLAIGAMYNKNDALHFMRWGHPRLPGSGVTNIDSLPTHGDAEKHARNIVNAVLLRFKQRWHLTSDESAIVCTPWRMRSVMRLVTGVYEPMNFARIALPIHAGTFYTHFPHVDPLDNTKIRFFKCPEHAILDRHTSTTLGRYLTDYYSDVLTPDEIRDIAAAFTSGRRRANVAILSNSGDIVNAYILGPRSCMAHDHSYFHSRIHPTCVYGGESSLHLAVLRDGAQRITARGLVWPERKYFNRLYGDTQALGDALRDMGYTRGSFAGATVRYVRSPRDPHVMIMPYIDKYNRHSERESNGAMYAAVNTINETVVLYDDPDDHAPDDGEVIACASSTGGILEVPVTTRCSDCGCYTHDVTTVRGGAEVCEGCTETYLWAFTDMVTSELVPGETRVWYSADTNAYFTFKPLAAHQLSREHYTRPAHAARIATLEGIFTMQATTTLPSGAVVRACDVQETQELILGPLRIPASVTLRAAPHRTERRITVCLADPETNLLHSVRTISATYSNALRAAGATERSPGTFVLHAPNAEVQHHAQA